MRLSYAKFLHLVPLLVVSLLLSSCGGGGGGSNTPSPGPSTTSPPGNSTTPPQANQNPSPAVGASNSFAYVMNFDSISAFKIDGANGNLSFVGTLPAPAGSGNVRMAVHPSGRFAYVMHATTGDITAYRINADGTLTAVTAVDARAVSGCCLTVHPSGNFLNVLTVTFKPAPSAINDTFEYTVVTYAINASTGALSLMGESSSPFTLFKTSQPADIVIDPSGRFAYLVIAGFNPGSGKILTYTINSGNGAWTPVASPNLWSHTIIGGMIPHPSGKFAYVDLIFDESDPTIPKGTAGIQAYSIADTGALTEAGVPLTGNFRVSLSGDFRVIAVEPSGRFLYAAAGNSSTGYEVSGYIINPATGMLTSVGPPVAAGPLDDALRSISVDPSGKFVYVLNDASESIYAYTIDPVTGSLTPSGAPVPTIPGPTTLITTTRTGN
jgi:6-phosphogluconolactonase